MRNIFYLLFMAIFLSACSSSQNSLTLDETSLPKTADGFDYYGTKNRIDDLNHGLAPKAKATGKSQPPAQNQSAVPAAPSTETKVHLDNLADVYNRAAIKTNMGDMVMEFYPADSPLTVNNFLNLAKKGFYNGTKFHKINPAGYILGGDPNTKDSDPANDGQGGPGYRFENELNSHPLQRGNVAMASFAPAGNGSQFFVVFSQTLPSFEGANTNFGYIVEGLEVLDAISGVATDKMGRPNDDIIIKQIDLLAPTGRGSELIDQPSGLSSSATSALKE